MLRCRSSYFIDEKTYGCVVRTGCYHIVVEWIQLDIQNWSCVPTHTCSIDIDSASLQYHQHHIVQLQNQEFPPDSDRPITFRLQVQNFQIRPGVVPCFDCLDGN